MGGASVASLSYSLLTEFKRELLARMPSAVTIGEGKQMQVGDRVVVRDSTRMNGMAGKITCVHPLIAGAWHVVLDEPYSGGFQLIGRSESDLELLPPLVRIGVDPAKPGDDMMATIPYKAPKKEHAAMTDAKWIALDDREPNPGDVVLAYWVDCDEPFGIAKFNSDDDWDCIETGAPVGEPDYWMPLPPAPGAQQTPAIAPAPGEPTITRHPNGKIRDVSFAVGPNFHHATLPDDSLMHAFSDWIDSLIARASQPPVPAKLRPWVVTIADPEPAKTFTPIPRPAAVQPHAMVGWDVHRADEDE